MRAAQLWPLCEKRVRPDDSVDRREEGLDAMLAPVVESRDERMGHRARRRRVRGGLAVPARRPADDVRRTRLGVHRKLVF